MANNYTTNTINLNSYDFSENDKIVVMYSKEKGLIRALAKGCKKPKSKLGATMQTLVANKIVMNKGRNLDVISQAEAIEGFKNVKKDFSKLSVSMYCAEIVANFGIEEDLNSKLVYELLYKTLETVAAAKNTTELLLCALRFQLKIMDIFGFQISLNNCSNCAKAFDEGTDFKFSISSGGILCDECFRKLTNLGGKVVSVHPKIIKFLNTLYLTDFDEKTEFDEKATEKVCITCFNLIKDYISYHSPKLFKTVDVLDFAGEINEK